MLRDAIVAGDANDHFQGRHMAQHRMFVACRNAEGVPWQVNTVLSFATMGAALASPVFGFPNQAALSAMFYATGGTTVASGLSYVPYPGNTAVRFIK